MMDGKKRTRGFLIGIGIFGLIGIASFILGYGLRDGWEAVGAWFTSRWAVILYAGLGIYGLFLIIYMSWTRVMKFIGKGDGR